MLASALLDLHSSPDRSVIAITFKEEAGGRRPGKGTPRPALPPAGASPGYLTPRGPTAAGVVIPTSQVRKAGPRATVTKPQSQASVLWWRRLSAQPALHNFPAERMQTPETHGHVCFTGGSRLRLLSLPLLSEINKSIFLKKYYLPPTKRLDMLPYFISNDQMFASVCLTPVSS